MDKPTLRREILEDFATITTADRVAWSEAIAQTIMGLPELAAASGPVMAFLSMDDELDTDPLICGVLEAGVDVYSPCTLLRERQLIPTKVTSMDAVCSGVYGIREPVCEDTIEPEDLGMVVVPAIAYDRRGWRLGRGGGFYDRFLQRLSPDAVTCGVVFSRHLLDEVPTESHDLPVQLVVTERDVLRPGATRVLG